MKIPVYPFYPKVNLHLNTAWDAEKRMNNALVGVRRGYPIDSSCQVVGEGGIW